MNDPPADPFGEWSSALRRWRCRLLGADFVFETDDVRVDRLVQRAFAGLPRYRLRSPTRTLRVRIILCRRARRRRKAPPRPRVVAGADIVTATVDSDNYAVLAPSQGSALLRISTDMLRNDYHVRYELLEFAVITLAVRALGLVPLHAACVSLQGRAALLVGASGSGKSTLALQGASAGLTLLAEDSVFVEPLGLRAAAIPNYLYLRTRSPRQLAPAGIRRELARARVIRRRSGVRKRALDLRRTSLSIARAAPRITAVILLTRRRARIGGLLVRERSFQAIARLRAMQAYAAARREWPSFERSVKRLPCYELRRTGDPADGVAAVQALLRQLPPG